MRPKFYRQVFSVQTRHWWGRNRRRLSLDLLRRFDVPKRCLHLDLGCGTGQNLGLLESLTPSLVVGIDVSPIALDLARKVCQHCELVRSDINNALPFAEKMFDIVTIFNVLYHAWVESEAAVLREVRRILKVNGVLLITEPAFATLAREIDVADMAKRRYRLKPFVELLQAAEFDVVFSNYFTSFGAPIIVGTKALKFLAGKSAAAADVPDMLPMHPILNAAFYGLSRIESGLLKASVPMPFGTTIICVGRRR